MIAMIEPADELRRQWRRQILAHRTPREIAARHGLVALSLVDQSNSQCKYVEIENLLVVLLYDDHIHNHDRNVPNRVPLRFAAYGVRRDPHGVQWGGAENSRLFKNLSLSPQYPARGQRIDRRKTELLSLALKLDHRLTRATRHVAARKRDLQLPALWAGFRPGQMSSLRCEGPEFEEACRHAGAASGRLCLETVRRLDGLTLLPLDWVSQHVANATAVFAELTPATRCQVFRIEGMPDGLMGYHGASAIDFYSSRYRKSPLLRDTQTPELVTGMPVLI